MSRVDDLTREHRPNGVELRAVEHWINTLPRRSLDR